MTTNREENMSDARPATPAEAPRHLIDQWRKRIAELEEDRPYEADGMRECANDLEAFYMAASSGVSAARLRNRMQEIQARVDNAIFSKIDPDVPYLLAELKTLTDALASALEYMQHKPTCPQRMKIKLDFGPGWTSKSHTKPCDCGLEDVLTILRAEKEQK